jgi:signal peptidase I
VSRSRELIGTLVLALLVAAASRIFLLEPFSIPSGSMLPTLWIGDHLFVNKLVFGPRVPFSEFHLPAARAPERGEVVVFSVAVDGEKTYPADRRTDLPRADFVKRVIGLPGERIDIVDGVVFVNGEPIESRKSGEHFTDEVGRRSRSSPGAISCSATTATGAATAASGVPCGSRRSRDRRSGSTGRGTSRAAGSICSRP